MIDISNYSKEEIIELEKLIHIRKVELKATELTKTSLREDKRIVDYLFKKFPGKDTDNCWSEAYPVKIADPAFSVYKKITDSMINLCDMAFENYYIAGEGPEARQRRCGSDQTPIARQLNVIKSDYEGQYKNMWNDLWEVFNKYAIYR